MDAFMAGKDLENYDWLRGRGMSHTDAMSFSTEKQRFAGKGVNDTDMSTMASMFGVTPEQIAEAKSTPGLDLTHYAQGIMSGATHDQLMEAHLWGTDLGQYNRAISGGTSEILHQQIINAIDEGKRADEFEFPEVTKQETNDERSLQEEAERAGLPMAQYNRGVQNGLSHDDLISVFTKKGPAALNQFVRDAIQARNASKKWAARYNLEKNDDWSHCR